MQSDTDGSCPAMTRQERKSKAGVRVLPLKQACCLLRCVFRLSEVSVSLMLYSGGVPRCVPPVAGNGLQPGPIIIHCCREWDIPQYTLTSVPTVLWFDTPDLGVSISLSFLICFHFSPSSKAFGGCGPNVMTGKPATAIVPACI